MQSSRNLAQLGDVFGFCGSSTTRASFMFSTKKEKLEGWRNSYNNSVRIAHPHPSTGRICKESYDLWAIIDLGFLIDIGQLFMNTHILR